MYKPFKWANFPGKHPDAGVDQCFLERGVHKYKEVGGCFAAFISFILNIPWKWNSLVSLRQNYVIFIGYLIAGREEWTSSGSATVMCSQSLISTEQHWPLQVIQLSEYLFKGHYMYLKNSLIWLYGSLLISYSVMVWFPLKRNSPHGIHNLAVSY